ncbi:oxygen-independent coproporphyrinogen III oxidase, partial [Microvirga sp. 3-52]|nr:oxygen-independent coproporphyrinogen III oxidase [Microvirga sp. 3-52]
QVGNGIRPIQQSHIVTPVEAMEEEMFLGLRKTDGISTALFHEKFGQSLTSVYGETIQALIDKELIEVNGDRVQLTRNGVFRGNEVFQQFLA